MISNIQISNVSIHNAAPSPQHMNREQAQRTLDKNLVLCNCFVYLDAPLYIKAANTHIAYSPDPPPQ